MNYLKSLKKNWVILIFGIVILFLFSSLVIYTRYLNNKSNAGWEKLLQIPKTAPTAAFELGIDSTTVAPNQVFDLRLLIQTDKDDASVFASKIRFEPSLFEVVSIVKDQTFIKDWIFENFDNNLGTISLAGGVPDGYKTSGSPQLLATLKIKAKKIGSAPFKFDKSSAIYRKGGENDDILNIPKKPLTITVKDTNDLANIPLYTTILMKPAAPPCKINSVKWDSPQNPIPQGQNVNILVYASGFCKNKSVAFRIFEDDGIFGESVVKTKIFQAPFVPRNDGYFASTSWLTEAKEDGIFGITNPAEYFVSAWIVNELKITHSDFPELRVKNFYEKSDGGSKRTIREGDLNEDNTVNFQDFAKLYNSAPNQKLTIDQLRRLMTPNTE